MNYYLIDRLFSLGVGVWFQTPLVRVDIASDIPPRSKKDPQKASGGGGGALTASGVQCVARRQNIAASTHLDEPRFWAPAQCSGV